MFSDDRPYTPSLEEAILTVQSCRDVFSLGSFQEFWLYYDKDSLYNLMYEISNWKGQQGEYNPERWQQLVSTYE